MANAEEFGIVQFPMDRPSRASCNIIGPEQGRTLPGMTIVCGDSHTDPRGPRRFAFGIGTSEVEHVLATRPALQARPKTLAITVDGDLRLGSPPRT